MGRFRRQSARRPRSPLVHARPASARRSPISPSGPRRAPAPGTASRAAADQATAARRARPTASGRRRGPSGSCLSVDHAPGGPDKAAAASIISRHLPPPVRGGVCFGGQGLPPPPSRPGHPRRLTPFDTNAPTRHIDSDITAWFPGSRQLPITSDHLSPVLLSVLTTFSRLPIGSDHFRVRFDMICLVKTDKKADRARRTDSKARHGEAAEPWGARAAAAHGRRVGLRAAGLG